MLDVIVFEVYKSWNHKVQKPYFQISTSQASDIPHMSSWSESAKGVNPFDPADS